MCDLFPCKSVKTHCEICFWFFQAHKALAGLAPVGLTHASLSLPCLALYIPAILFSFLLSWIQHSPYPRTFAHTLCSTWYGLPAPSPPCYLPLILETQLKKYLFSRKPSLKPQVWKKCVHMCVYMCMHVCVLLQSLGMEREEKGCSFSWHLHLSPSLHCSQFLLHICVVVLFIAISSTDL